MFINRSLIWAWDWWHLRICC